jgi:hypothetical protein
MNGFGKPVEEPRSSPPYPLEPWYGCNRIELGPFVPPTADVVRLDRHVCFVLKAAIRKGRAYGRGKRDQPAKTRYSHSACAGYENVNDAVRHDPAMRWIVGGKAPRGARLRSARWAASLHKMRHCGSGAFDVRYTLNSGAKSNVAGCRSWFFAVCGKEAKA